MSWLQHYIWNVNYTWGHAIDNVVGFFKDYQDEQLEVFSHDDLAWKQTWNNKEDDDRMLIGQENKNFYRDLLQHIVREVDYQSSSTN